MGRARVLDGVREAIRQPAEVRCATELSALAAVDQGPRPPGWRLSPRSVELFVMGSEQPISVPGSGDVQITSKFVGDRRLIQVAIATLASDRALLLTGEPGTAKSWLSEHLAAAISGTSSLTIQGTAGTTEEQIKYGWNYALLIAEGPSHRALVESPILRGMNTGQLVRFEELTRCSAEVQDALISVLSEQQIVIPELDDTVQARRGFAIIATANSRDRGVNEMSAALKRRFNFVTIPVISDLAQEMEIVARRSRETIAQLGIQDPGEVPLDLVELMTTVFAELRNGRTIDGTSRVKTPSTVLSTAELISAMTNGALMASFFGNGKPTVAEGLSSMLGAIAKEHRDDIGVLRDYFETIVKTRREGLWPSLYQAAQGLFLQTREPI